MATERLKTVKPSGGDYTSLAAAIAGEAGNLVSADEWLHIECYAMTDGEQVYITGYTTSEDCHILVDTPTSERHKGVLDRSGDAYYLVIREAQGCINVQDPWVTLEGLQAENTLPWASRFAFQAADNFTGITRISKCIGVSNGYHAFFLMAGNIFVMNCLAIESGRGFSGRQDIIFFNCTAANNDAGFDDMYGSHMYYNCLAANNSIADFTITSNPLPAMYNCASSDATAGAYAGSGNRINQTFSFVDAANGDYHLAENDTGARGHGLTDPGSGLYLDDIDGDIRTVPWDIGADQFVSGGGDKVPIGAINRYYRTLMGGQAR